MGVLDKFLDAIRLNDDEEYDEEDEYLEDNLLEDEEDEDEEDDFLDDDLDEKPRKNFFDRFAKKKSEPLNDFSYEDEDEEDDLDEVFEEKPVRTRSVKPSFSSSRKKETAAKTPVKRETPVKKETPKETPRYSAKQEKAPRTSSKITPMRSTRRNSTAAMEVCVIKPSSMEDSKEIVDTLIDNSTVILNLEGLDVDVAQRIIDFTSGACYSLGGSLQSISSYIFVLGPYNVDITGDLQNILGGSSPSVKAGY
ncbi:MAG: cell division protein SepF [Clostridiales bacterium]|nr:cell division protein SepF [Clostridiales bacterium]